MISIQHDQKMDIQALKIDLVQKILSTNNPALLSRVNTILKKEVDKDWWDQLPVEVQESIIEGIHDIETGKVFTHEQVMQEAKQKYGF
ncbi:MAG: hypothetical protein Q8N05_14345 [Bacteroidota bacterium]|nr:hypothetical protein [Bacteroidota bacterium]